MQIKITTDYAIRSILYLATHKGVVNAQEIGENMGIPGGYITKVLRSLRVAGIVSSMKGGDGGYMLMRTPEQITMQDIVAAMEKTVRINRCLEDDGFCSRHAAASCPVHDYYCGLQRMLDDYLSGTTVQDILDYNCGVRKHYRKPE